MTMSQPDKRRRRVSVTLDEELYERLKYWSDKREMSLNEYFKESLEHMIAYENRDYDLPTAEIARLNQLTDLILTLSSNQESLEQVIISGFDSLLGLTRGDNYLLDGE